jgi:Icc protein
MHLSFDNELLFNKYNAESCLNHLISLILLENPDVIFMLGDLSQDGSVESYLKLKEMIAPFKCNILYIPGNHDNLDNITSLNSNTIKQVDYFDISSNRFIFLNSHLKNSDSGFLSQDEINKINSLHDIKYRNHLVIHHHFIPLGAIIDDYMLINSNIILELLNTLNIFSVFTGHIHNNLTVKYKKTKIYHCPSTCVQFNLSMELKTTSKIGYRIVKLNEKTLKTDCRFLQI